MTLTDVAEVQCSKNQIPRYRKRIGDRKVQALHTERRDLIQSGIPIKSLGKGFGASLHDRDNVMKLERHVEDGLKKMTAVDFLESSKHGFTSMPCYQD